MLTETAVVFEQWSQSFGHMYTHIKVYLKKNLKKYGEVENVYCDLSVQMTIRCQKRMIQYENTHV